MKRFRWFMAALLLVAAAPAGLSAQSESTITGRVVAQETGQPVPDVQVQVVGTTRGSLTGPDGRYRIAGIPAGTYIVRATRTGYNAGAERVVLAAGGTAVANFTLAVVAVSLDAIVVTATGEQQKRELANATSSINADQVVETAPITSFSELLTGRAAGVNILQSSGTTGTNSRIRIRGSTSVSLSNEPIVFIDGIRAYSGQNTFSIGTGGQSSSRLNDINPEDIESVEVIKGPSAATLYGTDAANGVIRITTKRGRAGVTRWNVYVEQGRLNSVTEFPENFAGLQASGRACFLFQVGAGSCTQSELVRFQALNDPVTSPFSDGNREQYGVSVSGGAETLNYFISAEYEDEVGVLALPDTFRSLIVAAGSDLPRSRERPNSLERISLRANFGAKIAENLQLNLSTGYISSDLNLPQNDNNALGIVPSGILGSPFRDDNFGFGFLTPGEIFAIDARQEVERFIGSANLNWQPLSWLVGRATLGIDNTARDDNEFVPVGEVPFGSAILGSRTSNRIQVLNYTADVGATANFELTPSISSRTSVGVQYFRDLFEGTFAFGEELGPGARTVSAAANQFADESTVESITLGTFVEQQFGYNDRLFVTGAVRFDDNSAFGQEFDLITYPKVGASYVVLDDQGEPFFQVLNSLRLRGAYGAAGRAPGTTDALRFFSPVTATVAGSDVPGVVIGELGNVALEPERSTELEVGLDAGFFNGRLGGEVTYYNKNTTDLLVNVPLPPSLGASANQFRNLGEVRNTGWEVALNATPLLMRNARWEVNLTASNNENELVELGLEETDSILFGPQRFQEGFPLGGFFARPVTFNDANNNGIIERGEFTIGDTEQFIGPAFPETELSINSGLTLFDVVRLFALFDYRTDFYQYNFTEEFRCRFQICRGLFDADAPLDEQARALQTVLSGARRSAAPYIEDATFWKLREASITFMVPDRWANRIGASSANLSLQGRNLKTWTDYSGLDPELNQVATANFTSREFLTQPPVRTWIVRLNLGF